MRELDREEYETLNLQEGGGGISLDSSRNYRSVSSTIHKLDGEFDGGYWIVRPQSVAPENPVMVQHVVESPQLVHKESDYYSISSSMRLWTRGEELEDYQIVIGGKLAQEDVDQIEENSKNIPFARKNKILPVLKSCVPWAMISPDQGISLATQTTFLCRFSDRDRIFIGSNFKYENHELDEDPILDPGESTAYMRGENLHVEFGLASVQLPGEPQRQGGARAYRVSPELKALFIAGISIDKRMQVEAIPEYINMGYKDGELDFDLLGKSWNPYVRVVYSDQIGE